MAPCSGWHWPVCSGKYGEVDEAVLKQVKFNFEHDAGLKRWLEIGQAEYTRRKEVIARHLEKISLPNPKPKKLPKIVVRKPIYKAGDCLSILLRNDMYGAALVLASDHSDIEYGKNLIGLLNYMENTEPELVVFQKRDWLIRTHHNYENTPDIGWYTATGHRRIKSKLHLIGNIPLLPDDPQQSSSLIVWEHLGEQIISQRDWDQTH